ncbi:class I SAM-dependent methyltransferase [Conchiformibius kuhniae]|uniref:Class I SAM-dependent methyltransferase n=1 Tax=Conchiformibius kuhniae TaxID=211502 RepID=A0A8T9MUD5_9NEIS|nr:SAM-dependent methyltransferase [Conchiformibius kuhniae]UOP04851.1 SAM-dependent methyltransferase [Conchiformibius kuhniae]
MTTASLPPPDAGAQAACDALCALIRAEAATQGILPFSRFMALALYHPQHGYYTGGAHKIGAGGDFVTAPELTPLFARTLAVQLAQLLPQTDGNVYEFGAGTGALAAQLLHALPEIRQYVIVEVSPDLAERQRAHIAAHAPEHAEKVVHLSRLPEHFDGIIIGNEVLDAMPVERVKRTADGGFRRIGVAWRGGKFVFEEQNLDDENLLQAAAHYFPPVPDYVSELHPEQHAFVRTLAEKLRRGGMIFLDYGFDAAQYYHPQRADGTLMGHHRHHSIHDPFFRIGLTDLTAHVNFTDIAQAGCDSGLDLIGYTTQARFLLNLGIAGIMAQAHPDPRSPDYIQAAAAVQVLTAPQEMGELFKVIAFGKNVDADWLGFTHGDLCHKL